MSYQTKIKFSLLSLKEVLIVSSAKPDSKLLRVSDIQGQGCFCCSLAAGDSPLPRNTPDPFILRGWSVILEFIVHQPGTRTDTLLDQQGLKWVYSRSRGAVTLGKISFDKQGFNGTLAWWTSVGAGSCSKDWSELFDSVTALYLGEGRRGRSTTIDYYIFMKSERYWNSSLQTWTLWYVQLSIKLALPSFALHYYWSARCSSHCKWRTLGMALGGPSLPLSCSPARIQAFLPDPGEQPFWWAAPENKGEEIRAKTGVMETPQIRT